MRLGPLSILGIVDHAVQFYRRRWDLALTTVIPCSLPLAAAATLWMHVIVTAPRGSWFPLVGAILLVLLVGLRAIGWGAGSIVVEAILRDEPIEPTQTLRRALKCSIDLFTVQALPLAAGLAGLLLTVGPLALALVASNLRGNFFASIGLAIAAATVGSFVLLGAISMMGRRSLAFSVVAQENAAAPRALKRSKDLVLGQSVRACLLLGFLLMAFVVLWITLIFLVPSAIQIFATLTGWSSAATGIFSASNPTYLVFQGAAAFVLMEPVRCFSLALFHSDCKVRREGADLKSALERWGAAARTPR